MLSDELGMKLHDRATRGEALSPEEQAHLDNWYAEQDRIEASMLGLADRDTTAMTLQGQVDSTLVHLSGAMVPTGMAVEVEIKG